MTKCLFPQYLTLPYENHPFQRYPVVDLPGFQKQNFDPTFIASVFTGALSTFGLATAKDKKNGNGVSKEEMEAMIAKSNTSGGEQIIRVQTPLTINGAEVVRAEPPKATPPKDA